MFLSFQPRKKARCCFSGRLGVSGIKPSLDCHARKRKKKLSVLTILLTSISKSPKTAYLVNIIHLEIRFFR